MFNPTYYEVAINGDEVQALGGKLRESEIADGNEESDLDPPPVYWEAARRWLEDVIKSIMDYPQESAFGCTWETIGNFSRALEEARRYGPR